MKKVFRFKKLIKLKFDQSELQTKCTFLTKSIQVKSNQFLIEVKPRQKWIKNEESNWLYTSKSFAIHFTTQLNSLLNLFHSSSFFFFFGQIDKPYKQAFLRKKVWLRGRYKKSKRKSEKIILTIKKTEKHTVLLLLMLKMMMMMLMLIVKVVSSFVFKSKMECV